jgi:hypothetical protein
LSDERARDILHQLSTRAVCGSRLISRVGRRAWERPRVAISNRIYRQYRLPDPWDPAARGEATPIGLGPVSLRLGTPRREPAPHLKPKAPREQRSGNRDAMAGLPNIPRARKPPAPTPPPVSKSAASMSAISEDTDARALEVAERMRAAEVARGTRRRAPGAPETASPVAPGLPVRPDAAEATLARAATEEVEARPADRTSRGTSGRFRMAAKTATRAPIVRPVDQAEPDPVDDITEEVELPTRRRVMPSLGGGSMDDFFGAAAQMGRLSMPKAEPEE